MHDDEKAAAVVAVVVVEFVFLLYNERWILFCCCERFELFVSLSVVVFWFDFRQIVASYESIGKSRVGVVC
jgi:hypothetical protein